MKNDRKQLFFFPLLFIKKNIFIYKLIRDLCVRNVFSF